LIPSAGGCKSFVGPWRPSGVCAPRESSRRQASLRASADELERRGLPRHEAEATAVERLGAPRSFAQGFSRPTWRDWLIDAIAWCSARAASTLLALGALMVLVEVVSWSVGPGPLSADAVRVWRTCRGASFDGECVGGWSDSYAPALVVLGGSVSSPAPAP
jgi:hypothetical protein